MSVIRSLLAVSAILMTTIESSAAESPAPTVDAPAPSASPAPVRPRTLFVVTMEAPLSARRISGLNLWLAGVRGGIGISHGDGSPLGAHLRAGYDWGQTRAGLPFQIWHVAFMGEAIFGRQQFALSFNMMGIHVLPAGQEPYGTFRPGIAFPYAVDLIPSGPVGLYVGTEGSLFSSNHGIDLGATVHLGALLRIGVGVLRDAQ